MARFSSLGVLWHEACAATLFGIKRWQDVRPTDPVERICGGDFAAFAAYYGMDDANAGATLLYALQSLREMLRKGDLEAALAFLEWQAGE